MESEHLKKNKPEELTEIPFFTHGKLFYDVVKSYVTELVTTHYKEPTCDAALNRDLEAKRFVQVFFELADEATPDYYPEEWYWKEDEQFQYSCDQLIDFLTENIFMVSGQHRHVGSVADFFRDTRFVSTSWKEGTRGAPPQQ